MGLLHLFIAALAATATLAADAPCACVNETQTIDPIKNPMIFFQQPTLGGLMNGQTCGMPCNFKASLDKDDPAYSLQIQILTNKLGDGIISIGGMSGGSSGTVSTINSNTPLGIVNQLSYGPSITLDLTEASSNLGEFMIVVQKVSGRADPPIEKTTTTSLPTPPYDPKFKHNPRLVANDIMLAFDLSSPDIKKYQQFARDMIKELALNPKSLDSKEPEDCGIGSRLSVVGLSSLSGFDNLYAPYWTTSGEQADGNIGSFVQISSGKFFFRPVEDKYLFGFDKKENNGAPDDIFTNCTNRGKIFILLSSSSPVEYNYDSKDSVGLETKFVNNGVHQILVYFKLDAKDKKYYDLYDSSATNSNIWNFFEITGGDDDVEKFYNSFLVDSKEPMTCQPTSTNNKVQVIISKTSAEPAVINIPPYYDAKKGDGTGQWVTIKHYCNFQETTVQIIKDSSLVDSQNPEKTTKLCLTVFYDLETGKDFVSIFSGDPNLPSLQEEVVRLTGRDVSGTTFELPDAFGSIFFSSDEKNVYDGFRAEIKRAGTDNKCS